jgi:hypothetical protein
MPNEYRQFFRAQVQKDLQQAEATEGKLDISLLMSPLTDEVLDRIATETIGKYWSAKYSKKYVGAAGDTGRQADSKV